MGQLDAFGLTLACEISVALLMARSVTRPRLLLAVTSANCLTHPFAWALAMRLSPHTYLAGLGLIELTVVVTEALCYRWWLRLRSGRAIALSLLANATSLGTGWLLWLA